MKRKMIIAAPSTPCTDGQKTRVPYNANYIFWGN